ncbi:MAG: dienelactone hydrolase family protein [Nocardia sp.]|nr:dienelactone hydrolase family protein [Nocardia sp.]
MQNSTRLVLDRRSLFHGRRRRTYTLVRPAEPDSGAAVVLVLHGTLQTGDSIRKFSDGGFDRLGLGGNIVVYPDALHREWNGARKARMLGRDVAQIDDVGFLRAVVADVATTLGLVGDRVYAIGFSLGGQMAIRVIHDDPDLLTAAAIVSANQPAPHNLRVRSGAGNPIPVLSMHGTADPLAPFAGGYVGFRGMFPKGQHLSAARTAAYFARRNGIGTPPAHRWLSPPETVPGARVCRTDYRQSGCAPVTFYTIVDGGHQIPGVSNGTRLLFGPPTRAINAVDVIAEFFGLDAG